MSRASWMGSLHEGKLQWFGCQLVKGLQTSQGYEVPGLPAKHQKWA